MLMNPKLKMEPNFFRKVVEEYGICQSKHLPLPSFCKKDMFRPVRLSVRTHGFHPCKRGSIPLRATKAALIERPF
jgi:hypothetical protein